MTGRRHLTGVIAMLVIGVTAAGCTTEQSSTPGSRLPAPSSTSTTTSTTSTTTTTSTTSTTTTTLPPTTTMPAGPTAERFQIFTGGGGGGGWLLLGGWSSDRWRRPFDVNDEPVEPSLPPGTELTVTNLTTVRTATSGTNVEACQDGRVGPTLAVELDPPDPPGFGYSALALPTPDWPIEPRPVAVVANNVPAYAALGAAAVARLPVDGSLGRVVQTVVADLDGDGSEEVLVVYEYVQPSIRGTAGDFSVLLLVDAVTRASSTVASSFVGPGDADDALIERFRVLDVADLNGDGLMEVAVHEWFYEGATVSVWQMTTGELVEVLATSCGS